MKKYKIRKNEKKWEKWEKMRKHEKTYEKMRKMRKNEILRNFEEKSF